MAAFHRLDSRLEGLVGIWLFRTGQVPAKRVR